jgi:hypothetical protein
MNSDSGNNFLLNPGSQVNVTNGNQSFMQPGLQNYSQFNNNNNSMGFSNMGQQSNVGFMQQQQGFPPEMIPGSQFVAVPMQLHNNFMQNSPTEWRGQLSAADRYHVINQLGKAVQQALPPTHQSPAKMENLARSLEQHIYENASTRVSNQSYLIAVLLLVFYLTSLKIASLTD